MGRVLFAPNLRPPTLVVTAQSRQRVTSRRGVRIRASCDEACTLRATGRIVAAGKGATVTLLAASARVATRGQRVLELGLTPAGLARLSSPAVRNARLHAAITVRALDDDGNASVGTARVRVQR